MFKLLKLIYEWITVGPEFKIIFKFIEEESKNVHYILTSKAEEKNGLGSVRSNKTISLPCGESSQVINHAHEYAKNFIQVHGDPMQFITVLNTWRLIQLKSPPLS